MAIDIIGRGRATAERVRERLREVALQEARTQPEDRLLQRPVFIMSSVRSGSTLLRVMLNRHSTLLAPHELHLNAIKVELTTPHAELAMQQLRLTPDRLQFLLWDRFLHRELVRRGKRTIVEKTPADVLMWRKVLRCWPDARFIFLLRHPAAITNSWQRARVNWSRDEVAADIKRFASAMEEARVGHGGLVVKYEDITLEPEREMRRICGFLEIDYEPGMVDYAADGDVKFRPGLGDWSKKIKSGRIEPVEKLPSSDEIPAALLEISDAWGYV